MFVADLAAQFTPQVEGDHRRYNFETDFHALADAMGIRVAPGRYNLAAPGRPPLIMLRAEEYAPRRNFSGHHEIGHLMLKQCGVEVELIRRAESPEEAVAYIEAFADLAASLLLMPRPLLEEAHRLHGDGPAAVAHLMQGGRASLAAAMRRYVYADLDAQRAAFVVSGSYVSDAAACNLWLPIWRYDRVPEIQMQMPDAELLMLGGRRVLGTVAF